MSVRSPRAWLQIGGVGLVNLLNCEVSISRHAFSSSFMVYMALDDKSNPGPTFWSDAAPISASIVATNGDGVTGLKTLIKGQIDRCEVDWHNRKVTAHGSDLMAAMQDTRSDEHFPNMTSSEVVEKIVGKHGFNLHIDGKTDKAGTSYDGKDYAFNSDNENEWDVIQSLAARDGKVAFMIGDDFYYTDPGNVIGGDYSVHYVPPAPGYPPSLNGMTLKTFRDLQMENATVKTASFHPYDKKPYVADEAEKAGPGGGSTFNAPPSGTIGGSGDGVFDPPSAWAKPLIPP